MLSIDHLTKRPMKKIKLNQNVMVIIGIFRLPKTLLTCPVIILSLYPTDDMTLGCHESLDKAQCSSNITQRWNVTGQIRPIKDV